jgi:hypothetical protein
MRAGAGQDVSESDGAGARHTADRAKSRTHNRVVKLSSGWVGSGPTAIPVLRGRIKTAIRQEATSKDEVLRHGRTVSYQCCGDVLGLP